MSAIGPGDWVECVDASPRYVPGVGMSPVPAPLVKGAVYRVERVVYDARWDETGIVLDGIRENAWRIDGAFNVDRFRPIYRPKSEIIESLKQPAPDAVRELITAD